MKKEKSFVVTAIRRLGLTLFFLGITAFSASGQTVSKTVTSDLFSLGYGYIGVAGSFDDGWNTYETSSVNTPTTQGDFTFSPTVTGSTLSSSGPRFIDRVLLDVDPDRHGYAAFATSATISGGWSGALPSDAASNPNYTLTLHITSISIYASNYGWGEKVPAFFRGDDRRPYRKIG